MVESKITVLASEIPNDHCTGIYYITQVYLVNIPWVLFIFGAIVNFRAIRAHSIGLVRSFSLLFKLKRYTCMVMTAICFIKIITFLVEPAWWGHDFSNCESFEILFGVARFCEALVWIGNIQLMTYQYRKGVSEQWYSQKMFWLLTFVFSVFTFAQSLNVIERNTINILISVVQTLLSFILIILLIKTKVREPENFPRSVSQPFKVDLEKLQNKSRGMTMLAQYQQ